MASKLTIKDKLIPLRLNELLDAGLPSHGEQAVKPDPAANERHEQERWPREQKVNTDVRPLPISLILQQPEQHPGRGGDQQRQRPDVWPPCTQDEGE